jgi:hypothetical protein
MTITRALNTWAYDNFDTKYASISITANTTGLAKKWTLTTTYVNGTTTTFYIIQEA